MKITVTKATTLKEKPDSSSLGFGEYFTDHMFICDYTEGKGWHDARIIPYQDISLAPSAMVFHYGQEIFEGLKAYRNKDGKINLFRPLENARRMNASADRLCIAQFPEEDFVTAVKELVMLEQDWVPKEKDTSLYIRPFMIATDPFIGVSASKTYKFIVILSPVGAYYKEGLNPVKIFVETEFVRAVTGGTGQTKCGGNYGASIKAQMKAKKVNYAQVLWLDGVYRKYVEEVGTMNVFFKINGEIVTPELAGSILPGITRNSVITVLKDKGIPVVERKISIDEIFEAAKAGKLEDAFGTGTAAVISPIGELKRDEESIVINNGKIGETAQMLYDTITGIQWQLVDDKFGWVVDINS